MLPKCNILCEDDSENYILAIGVSQKTYMAPLFRETNNADIAILYTFLLCYWVLVNYLPPDFQGGEKSKGDPWESKFFC